MWHQQERQDQQVPDPDRGANRPRLIVFAVSADGIDPAELGARLAGWVGEAGSVACWAAEPAGEATANEALAPTLGPEPRWRVAVASRRAAVFAAAHRQLHGSAAVAGLLALADAVQVSEQLDADPPDLMLVDEALFEVLPPAVAERLRGLHALMLCDAPTPCAAECVLARGLRGCLAVDAPPHTWEKAIAAVRRGELWLPRAALQQAVATSPPRDAEPVSLDGLTPREAEAVQLLREGLSNKEIGRRLGVCEDTVKKHLQHAFSKLGVHRRALVALGKRSRP